MSREESEMADMRCEDCNMTFKSYPQLQKHKEKFCIGASLGDPNSLAPSGPVQIPRVHLSRASDRSRDSPVHVQKIDELYDLKERNVNLNKLRDIEEAELLIELDQIESDRSNRSQPRHGSNRRRVSSRNSDSTMSLHFSSDDEYRQPYGEEKRNQQLRIAEEHGRQVADIRTRQTDLERQKDDIRRRLKELTSQDYGNSVALATSNLVKDLKEREEHNQEEIMELKAKMNNMQVVPSYIHTGKSQLYNEIATLQQNYLANGGNDPAILAQIAEMLRDAETMETKPPMKSTKKRGKKYGALSDQLIAFEIENQRLQRELLLMQEKGITNDKDNREKSTEDRFERDMKRMQMEHMNKMQQLHQEMELTKHQMVLEKYKRDLLGEAPARAPVEPPPAPVPQRPYNGMEVPRLNHYFREQPQHNMQDEEPLAMGFYDHNAGFTIFHDFLLGLDRQITAVRVSVSLYTDRNEMGDPSALPVVTCNPSPINHVENIAMIGLKQGVPKCTADAGLSLVVEVQAAEGPHSKISTACWSKIDLFDESGQLSAGRYRLPLRVPPVQPEMGSYDVTSLAQWGNAELFFRIVNQRDVGKQSQATIDPSTAGKYQYPPQRIRIVPPLVLRQEPITRMAPPSTRAPTSRHGPPTPRGSTPRTARSQVSQVGTEPFPLFTKFRPESVLEQSTREKEHIALLQKAQQDSDTRLSLPASPTPDDVQNTSRDVQAMLTTARERGVADLIPGEAVDLGFQVIRVKNAEPGEAKVRLTAYYSNSGDVAQSETSPITCSTTAVKSSFKHSYHVFGHQEALFRNVDLKSAIVLVARFYLRGTSTRIHPSTPGHKPGVRDDLLSQQDARLDDTEALVAWGTLPLIVKRDIASNPYLANVEGDISLYQASVGKFALQLYKAPVPDVDRIPLDPHQRPKEWTRYGESTVRIKVFLNDPQLGSSDESEPELVHENELPEHAWIAHQRVRPLEEPFTLDDGFDLYIDGCRFLPDSVTFTKVAGRILTRRYEMIGRDIGALCKPDSSAFNPRYDYRQEFRDANLLPTSTLLLKVYTIDRFTNELTVVGYSTLNIFVETGTDKQPISDDGGQLISLNEGSHQIRLYHYGPTGVDPMTESCMRYSNQRHIPCASLLVRLVKAPIDAQARLLRQDKVPFKDWKRLGLLQTRPRYSDRVYYSLRCKPTPGELRMYEYMVRRPALRVSSEVDRLAGRKHTTDKRIDEFMKNELSRLLDVKPMEQNMTFIAKYSPKHGLKVSIDSAMNLPWSNFTEAQICLNPPGAYYQGAPHAAYDKLVLTRDLDLNSSNKSPSWLDGLHHFTNRSYHRHLCLIIHLQEIEVTTQKDTYKYGLIEEAWTAVQVFEEEYCHTDLYQLPLYQGGPNSRWLDQMSREPLAEWTNRMLTTGQLELIEGASVFIRLCDGRRDDELTPVGESVKVELNTEYLPLSMHSKYKHELAGEPLLNLVPIGKVPGQFVHTLANKYRNLVYKLYEDEAIAS